MFADYLKGTSPEGLPLEVAFGRHMIQGDIARAFISGTAPNHVVTTMSVLGDTYGRGWAGLLAVWFDGFQRPPAKYKFYPGLRSSGNSDPVQGVDTIFNRDVPHTNTAWLRCELPSSPEVGIPNPDITNVRPDKLSGIYDCQLGDIYDADGDIISSDVLITNPADVLAFGLKEIRKYPDSRIDFASLEEIRQICDQQITPDWTTLPQGIGLTASYYNGAAFGTLIRKRIDPVVQFDSSTGAPEVGLNVDDFSARFEGKIRAKYTETFTFSLLHDNGARLWVDNLSTPLIDQWSTTGTHTATFAMVAGQFYDIKIEWRETGGSAALRLSWSSTSQSFQTIPQENLYPLAEPVNRFECHRAFTVGATFDDFLRAVTDTFNGGFQDVNGKLRFHCFDELSHTFAFNNSNIIKLSFKSSPRFSQQEILSLPNRFVAVGRDLDSRYLQYFDPPIVYDLPELQKRVGKINTETVNIGSGYRWQVMQNLAHFAKIRTAPYIGEFDGTPGTWPVMPGDLVTVSNTHGGWTGKSCIVLEATDKSVKPTPDERIFKCLVWGEDQDAESPTVPTGLMATVVSASAITWTWLASTDDIGVVGYEVSLDGGVWTDVGNVLIYNGTGFDAESTHGLRVRSRDLAGNRSAASAEVSATTEAIPPDPFNVALAASGSTITVNATSHGHKDNLINGNRTYSGDFNANGFQANGGSGQWAEIDFGTSRTINEINFISVNANGDINPANTSVDGGYASNNSLQMSYWNGSSWVAISTVTNSMQWKQWTFSPITTTKIRVDAIAVDGGALYVNEFEAWGF